MNNLRQAAEQALEALDGIHRVGEYPRLQPAITALRAALAEPEQEQEPVLLECVTCGTVYADGVPPQVSVKKPFGYLWPTGRHPEFRFTKQQLDGVDGMPVYASPAPTAEDIAQDWNLLKATQESLREHMAEIQRLRAALEQQQSDPLLEEQRLDIVATALRGHASTRDAIQWAIEAVERHHGIKGGA